MPILWQFLVKEYIKVLGLCTAAFIILLIAMRLEEIAQFAALGANASYLFRFILYQLPYILPIAIPISALISSLLLMKRLSQTSELTALRSSGFGLLSIMTPILLTAGAFSWLNFALVSEFSTHAHLMKRLLKKELKALNPLILLQSERLAHLKGVYAQSFGPSKAGEWASDVLICLYNRRYGCLNLLTAKELHAQGLSLSGQQVTLVTPLHLSPDSYDSLLVDNTASLTFPTPNLAEMFGNSGVKIENDHLSLKTLLTRAKELHQKIKKTKEPKVLSHLKNQLGKIYTEISRRLSLATAVFTLTLLGLSHGIQIARLASYRQTVRVLLLAALYIACFFLAKGLQKHFMAAILLYLLPQLFLVAVSLRTLSKINQGVL